jgi:hypothetical protein
MKRTRPIVLAGIASALSICAAAACTTADVQVADFQFKREGAIGVAVTGEVVNNCADPVWGIIRLTFRDKAKVVEVEDIWPTGRETIPAKSRHPVSWYFDIASAWTTVEPTVAMVEPAEGSAPDQKPPAGSPAGAER